MGATTASLSNLILMASGASASASLADSYSQASAMRTEADYSASMYARNASYARRNAREEVEQGDVEASRLGSRVRQLQGEQNAAAVSQGLVAGSGSAGELSDEAAKMGALDQLTIRNNAAKAAFGYDFQAGEYENAGKTAKAMARQQSRSTLATGGLRFLREIAAGRMAANKAGKLEAQMGRFASRTGSGVFGALPRF